ncbi:M56 family metallopeptidase [Croceitalea vernalis]|uniref:M56 family metallopeptidase n=1 Tax=Croceitalea vernalis TaxID=3075599 RepID=A0ABU3BFK5_9FLAO|nr:M56 family metallopeptidase [Croceitalea sp. P007]MDT0620937.1 M56 family metallopeptidase [Croceitalea sp. P007]
MLALIASCVIPGLVFIEYVEPTVTAYSNTNTIVETSNPIIIETAARDIDVINWSLIAWSIYSIGVVVFGVRFLRNLFQILNRIRKNPKLKEPFSIKVLVLEQLPPHTFFKYIFLNKEKFEANSIPKEVLLHEEIHAKQRHSIDVIFIEFLQVILWFNPLIFFFKKCIKLNHEFLADSAVIKKTISPSNYQNTLLSYLSQDSLEKYQSVNMANAINYSSIKKRFKVMKTHTSKKAILLRSLLLLPLLALMLYGFSEIKTIERTNPEVEKHIKEELDKVNQLEVNYYLDEASEKMMLEYQQFIVDYEKTNTIEYSSYQRVIAIYDLMTEEQRKSVKKYPEFPGLNNKISKSKPLSLLKFEDYKNKQKYAIWIDGKVVDNKVLNEFKASDFVYHSQSFVYKNARSKRFPQEYQVSLYTKKGFENTFKKEGVKSMDLAKFNVLAEKYNAISIEKRVIPLEDLKILESIYRKMSSEQKENAQAFPECLSKNIQKGASREQMKEYNALAKKYNEMSRDNMRIYVKDVERLEYIYGLMSDKQKADAEPFPDFPKPPPAPETPIYLSNKNTIIAVQEPASPSLNTIKGKATSIPQPPSPKVIKGQASTIPAPPPPPIPPSPLDHIIDMAKKGASFYFEGKKISSDKAIELIKKNKSLNISTTKSNSKNPQVRISKEAIKIGSLNKKKDLLNYAKELRNKKARFYYNDEHISAEEGVVYIAAKEYDYVETLPWINKTPEVKIYSK